MIGQMSAATRHSATPFVQTTPIINVINDDTAMPCALAYVSAKKTAAPDITKTVFEKEPRIDAITARK